MPATARSTIPSTTDRRREYRRARIAELVAQFHGLVQRALSLFHQLEDLWFEREKFETKNPKIVNATRHDWTVAYVALAGVFAAWVVDRLILRPTLEFMLQMMSENATFIQIGVYVLPMVVILIDILVGSLMWDAIDRRARVEIGRVQCALWVTIALVWVSMMPALTIEGHRAALHSQGNGGATFGLQLWRMVVLALVAHGGIVMAGRHIHDAVTLFTGTRKYRSLSDEIRRVREEYLKAVSAAVAVHGEYEHEIEVFNRTYPQDPVVAPALDRATNDLLEDWRSETTKVTQTGKPGSIN